MDGAEVFSNFRPIYMLFIVILLLSVLIAIFQRKGVYLLGGFARITISLLCSVVSAFLTYQIGILSDELGVGGDPVSFMMFVAVVILSIVNVIIFPREAIS